MNIRYPIYEGVYRILTFRLKHLKDFSARTYGALLPESWTVVRADKYVKVHSIGNI